MWTFLCCHPPSPPTLGPLPPFSPALTFCSLWIMARSFPCPQPVTSVDIPLQQYLGSGDSLPRYSHPVAHSRGKSKLLRLDERSQIGFLIGGPLILTVETRQGFSNDESWKIQEIRGLLPSMFLIVDMCTVDAWSKIENMLVSSRNVI